MIERRSEPRFLCADLVLVHIDDARGGWEVIANLEDISPSGARIQIESCLPEGAIVQLIGRTWHVKGRVVSCRFEPVTGYDIGVAFDEPGSWSPERFVPQHLLCLPSGVPKARAKDTPASHPAGRPRRSWTN